jgi:hypothetical protein
MTQLPPDDRQWQEFLRQNRPTPPPSTADLEERVMKAVEAEQQPALNRRVWAVPPAIAAGLLMAWSGYRTLLPLPSPSNSASLEAFLENNWQGVVGETSVSSQSNSVPADWMLLANTAQ